jgi:hypothetical protein
MDSEGRLYMPGFIGQSFDETGLRKKPANPRAQFSEPEKDVRQPGRGEAMAEAKLIAQKRAEMERQLAALIKERKETVL